MFDFVYLASQSPRRRQLLTQIGVKHELLLPDDDEDAEALEAERAGEAPQAYVERVALAKFLAARVRLRRRALPAAPILCCDTTVALGRRILGKPVDARDVQRMLSLLSARTHRVYTSVVVGTARSHRAVTSVSSVRFRALDARDIGRYIDSGDPFGKAGAYAIQGAAGAWVEHLSGSYSGIMGLPLFETAQLLRRARVKF